MTDQSAFDIENHTEPIIKSPGQLSTIIRSMTQGEDEAVGISPEEARHLEETVRASAEDARKKGAQKSSGRGNDIFTPLGEGKSGRVKAPEPVQVNPRTREGDDDIHEVAETDDHLSCHELADNDDEGPVDDASNADDVAGGERKIEEMVATLKDLDELSDSVDEIMGQKWASIEAKMLENSQGAQTEIAALREEMTALAKSVGAVRAELHNLTLRVSDRSISTSLKTPPIPVEHLKSRAVAAVPSGHRSKPSVTSVPSVKDHARAVGEFLSETPAYPKVPAIRKVKLTNLATTLGFNPPTGTIAPKDWTVEGIIKFLTAEPR